MPNKPPPTLCHPCFPSFRYHNNPTTINPSSAPHAHLISLHNLTLPTIPYATTPSAITTRPITRDKRKAWWTVFQLYSQDRGRIADLFHLRLCCFVANSAITDIRVHLIDTATKQEFFTNARADSDYKSLTCECIIAAISCKSCIRPVRYNEEEVPTTEDMNTPILLLNRQ